MSVVLIDYGSGNLRSAAKAFEAAGAKVCVSSDPETLESASHIVLPGVGAFADCMGGLRSVPGMIQALEEQVLSRHKSFLGICVGMQMLLETSEEHGIHQGLGWIKGEVTKLSPTPGAQNPTPLKIPHMGWNELELRRKHPLLAGLQNGDHAYFVHSYHAQCSDPKHVFAATDYGGEIAAAIGRDNIFGTQFHPEKSQAVGLRLLRNFLQL